MEAQIIWLTAFIAVLIVLSFAFLTANANKIRKTNRNYADKSNQSDLLVRESKNINSERPYYEKYFSSKTNNNDFLDLSGGILGI